jgi:hypothetical protein
MVIEEFENVSRMYKYNLLEIPRSFPPLTIRQAKSTSFTVAKRGHQSSLDLEDRKQSPKTSRNIDMSALRRDPLNFRHANNGAFSSLLATLFEILLENHTSHGSFYRSRPTEDLFNFRLVCKAFKTAASPLFEETFFRVRQGMLGVQSLKPLLQVSKSRFGNYVKCLIINLFLTNWRPGSVPNYDRDHDGLQRSVETYWSETRHYTWLTDISGTGAFSDIKDVLVEILDSFPNLKSICVNAYSFHEFFSCFRKNYLALIAHRKSGQGPNIANYRGTQLALSKGRVGYHQLLQTWRQSFEACYGAFQEAHTLDLRHFKLRVPQYMWRFGNPPFPRDIYRASQPSENYQAWYKYVEETRHQHYRFGACCAP